MLSGGDLQSFIDASWVKNYNTDNLWIRELLSWDNSLEMLSRDIAFLTFVLESSFFDHSALLDELSKISYLDITLIQASTNNMSIPTLYSTVSVGAIINLSTCFFPYAYHLKIEFVDEGLVVPLHISPGAISFFFGFYIWVCIKLFICFIPLRWLEILNKYFIVVYNYFYSIFKKNNVLYESLFRIITLSVIIFLLYIDS